MNNYEGKINSKHKDRLFRLLFGTEERKSNIISLYNALNNTNYTDDDDFMITTIGDAIYIGMKNDVSFLIDSYLPLWEQQSSYNPNMPLRGLIYFGKLYSAYVTSNNLNLYGSKLIRVPTPQYVVFYNGTKELDSIIKLKLSEAFINHSDSSEFEWTATMYNLNDKKNENLLLKCKPLADYMSLVNYIREYQDMGIEDAVDAAVQRCINEGILKEFLIKHRSEVLDVCITEFNEEVFVKGIREEGYEEGREKEIFSSVHEGDYSAKRGAEKLHMTIEDFWLAYKKAGYSIPNNL